MTDTPEHITHKQFEIYHGKSTTEKFLMLTDMMEYGVNQTMAVLRKWYPEITNKELKIEFFKIYYQRDFDSKQMDRWLDKFKQ